MKFLIALVCCFLFPPHPLSKRQKPWHKTFYFLPARLLSFSLSSHTPHLKNNRIKLIVINRSKYFAFNDLYINKFYYILKTFLRTFLCLFKWYGLVILKAFSFCTKSVFPLTCFYLMFLIF